MKITNGIKSIVLAAVVTGATMFSAGNALAETKITLKDGTVLTGEIAREGEQFIFLIVKIGAVEKQEFIRVSDIAEIVRDADPAVIEEANASTPVADTGPVLQGDRSDDIDVPPGATRIAYVTLHEGVGSYFNRDALDRSIRVLDEMPEETRPEIVVLHINSGGGALFELEKLVPYIRDNIEPKYRTVAWIESAISAACMTAWVVDEVYMMRKAPIGGCTGFRTLQSGTEAMEGRELEEVLAWMEEVSVWGKKEPLIMRAMQVYATLSCDIDPDTGEITWYATDQGEYMVSPANEVLTFNSHEAVKFGLAQGIADTKDELAQAMGCTEWIEVGHEADELMAEFRASVKTAELELGVLWQEMNIALNAMNATPELRNKRRHFGRAERKYKEMKVWAFKKAPSLLFYGQFTDRFFDQWDEQMDRIRESLRPD